MTVLTQPPGPDAIERAVTALQRLPRVTYAPPHVYSMCVPDFRKAPLKERDPVDLERLRLYVHVPFCNYACNYCFYAIRVGSDASQMERYVRALIRELDWVEAGTPLFQLFVGGGTPTVLPPHLLDELLSAVFARAPSLPEVVHTCEASPESITEQHLDVLKRHQVERVSMGIQSMEDKVLDNVKRDHSVQIALDACRMLVERGFILNVDLIYGLPGQTEAGFRRDFETVTALGVPSVTLYDLRTNDSTPVTKVVTDQERLDIQRLARWRWFVKDTAHELGFTQVRWHTYKRMDTVAARHDRKPTFTDSASGYQLGIGMSARSHLGYSIYRNEKSFAQYLSRIEAGQSPVQELMELDQLDRRTLFVARTLGDGKPLSRATYSAAFGHAFDADFAEVLQRLAAAELIEDDGETVEMSATGRLLHDLVTLSFYPDRALKLAGRPPALVTLPW